MKKDVKMPVQGIAYSYVVFVSLPNSHCIKMAMLATVRTSIKVQILLSGFRTICVVLVERMCLIIRSC